MVKPQRNPHTTHLIERPSQTRRFPATPSNTRASEFLNFARRLDKGHAVPSVCHHTDQLAVRESTGIIRIKRSRLIDEPHTAGICAEGHRAVAMAFEKYFELRLV